MDLYAPVMMTNVNCNGSEESLLSCPYVGWQEANCTRLAGVNCRYYTGMGYFAVRICALKLVNGKNFGNWYISTTCTTAFSVISNFYISRNSVKCGYTPWQYHTVVSQLYSIQVLKLSTLVSLMEDVYFATESQKNLSLHFISMGLEVQKIGQKASFFSRFSFSKTDIPCITLYLSGQQQNISDKGSEQTFCCSPIHIK